MKNVDLGVSEQMIIKKLTIGIALLAIMGLTACQAPARSGSESEQVYRDTCLACHAGSGAGSGAGTMLFDLTGLSAANGGQFPRVQVYQIIDGRSRVRAHGSPMPVWSDRFTPELILELTEYLASIQQ